MPIFLTLSIASLNLANDLLAAKQQLKTVQKENKQKIALLQSTIEQVLAPPNKKQA